MTSPQVHLVREDKEGKRAEAALSDDDRALFDAAPVATVVVSPSRGAIVDANARARDLLVSDRAHLVGASIEAVLPGWNEERLVRLAESGDRVPETRGDRVLEISAALVELRGERVVVVVLEDVTRRRQAEEALVAARERDRQLFLSSPLPCWVYDPETLRFLSVNDAAVREYGWSRDEFLSLTVLALRPEGDPEPLEEASRRPANPSRRSQWRHRRKDGSVIDVEVRSHEIPFEGRNAHLVVAQNVTERRRAEDRLQRAAYTDPLTGLGNRASLMEQLALALDGARRDGRYAAVLFLDLDRFKVVNDSLGHAAGDELLVEIARRLREQLRACDVAARLGGDEFILLLDRLRDPREATSVAARIHRAFSQPIHVAGHELVVSASIGVAFSTSSVERPEDLLRDADIAMYRAKAAGGAETCVFDASMHEGVLRRLRIESELRRALQRDEIELAFQPVVSLQNGAVLGYEALAHWEHPELGLVAPSSFVAVAEESGLVGQLGGWMLREACRHAARIPAVGSRRLRMSVNLSPRQLEPGLIEEVGRAVASAGMDPRLLCLEVTESSLIQRGGAAAVLSELRKLGVRVALDDFGTGYSSLSYLHRFALDVLKIDRSFVAAMETDTRTAQIVRTIVQLARNLGLEVVAEGVETPGQAAMLRQLGCDSAQGFLYGPPLRSDELASAAARSYPVH